MHLQTSGKGVEAMDIFHKYGGTHAILCHMPYAEVPIVSGKSFLESYELTLKMAQKCNSETPVRVFTAVGPYPVLLIGLAEKYGLEKAVTIMKEGMDSAQKLVLEHKAVALGEIGRPHFEVCAEILEASNEIMAYGMSLAKEADCPVVLHTEEGTPESMADLAKIADRTGLPRSHVVKHFSPPLVLEEENHGLFPSVLSSRSAITEALSKGTRFVMETDFMDEPSRPGAVLDIKTVPKRTMAYLDSGKMTEEQAWIIHKDNPEKLYGIEIIH
ncbi:TatD family hydrolase [Candidatus Methanomassiliicoccus intestinalis]|uniref:TatD family hydrolase n=1 Tax=Candidatus Methanomassiliicoccus intestinalis TaxID=1406512 RepID=UPI0037DD679D